MKNTILSTLSEIRVNCGNETVTLCVTPRERACVSQMLRDDIAGQTIVDVIVGKISRSEV